MSGGSEGIYGENIRTGGGSRRQTSEDVSEAGDDMPARGYYERFFREEKRLGMGAEGSVYLATHVIGGNVLGE